VLDQSAIIAGADRRNRRGSRRWRSREGLRRSSGARPPWCGVRPTQDPRATAPRPASGERIRPPPLHQIARATMPPQQGELVTALSQENPWANIGTNGITAHLDRDRAAKSGREQPKQWAIPPKNLGDETRATGFDTVPVAQLRECRRHRLRAAGDLAPACTARIHSHAAADEAATTSGSRKRTEPWSRDQQSGRV